MHQIIYYHIDVDECDPNLDNCDINAVCINNAGSFDCVCVFGYTESGQLCGMLAVYYCMKLLDL